MTEQNYVAQDELAALNRLLRDTLEAYQQNLQDVDFIEVLSVLLPYEWTVSDLNKLGNAVITIAAYSHQAALRTAATAGEYGAHLHRQRLEAVATIINDFMNTLREAIELLEKELL